MGQIAPGGSSSNEHNLKRERIFAIIISIGFIVVGSVAIISNPDILIIQVLGSTGVLFGMIGLFVNSLR